jgi:hypothetical protein
VKTTRERSPEIIKAQRLAPLQANSSGWNLRGSSKLGGTTGGMFSPSPQIWARAFCFYQQWRALWLEKMNRSVTRIRSFTGSGILLRM